MTHEKACTDHVHALLRSAPIFGAMDDEVLALIESRAVLKTWAAGQSIFLKGEDGTYLLLVQEGRVKLSILSSTGRELLIRIATHGDLVGEIACFDCSVRSADATAMEAVRALVLDRRDYRKIAARYPALHNAAIGYLSTMLRDTNDRLEALALHDLRARLARFVLFSLRELKGVDGDPNPLLALNLTQGDLAMLLGASRPKINRLLHDFRDQGVILPADGAWRCNIGALRAIADEKG